MIRVITILLSLCLSFCVLAQQPNQFTQYGYTQLYYNPALASVEDNFSLTLRHRNQWAGIEGAPTGQSLLISFPNISDVIGVATTLSTNSVGIAQKNEFSTMYSYKLKTAKLNVHLGLMANWRQFINDFSNENLIAIDGFDPDPSVTQERLNKNIFNLGAGLYIESENYYLGAAVPRTVKSNLDFGVADQNSQEARVLYAMGGFDLNLNNIWSIEQHTLFKYSENAPLDLDIQANFIYQEQAYIGMNLRAGGSQKSILESVGILLGFRLSPALFASMAYDFNTTELKTYQDGSFEVLLRYDLKKNKKPKLIQNPRHY